MTATATATAENGEAANDESSKLLGTAAAAAVAAAVGDDDEADDDDEYDSGVDIPGQGGGRKKGGGGLGAITPPLGFCLFGYFVNKLITEVSYVLRLDGLLFCCFTPCFGSRQAGHATKLGFCRYAAVAGTGVNAAEIKYFSPHLYSTKKTEEACTVGRGGGMDTWMPAEIGHDKDQGCRKSSAAAYCLFSACPRRP